MWGGTTLRPASRPCAVLAALAINAGCEGCVLGRHDNTSCSSCSACRRDIMVWKAGLIIFQFLVISFMKIASVRPHEGNTWMSYKETSVGHGVNAAYQVAHAHANPAQCRCMCWANASIFWSCSYCRWFVVRLFLQDALAIHLPDLLPMQRSALGVQHISEH